MNAPPKLPFATLSASLSAYLDTVPNPSRLGDYLAEQGLSAHQQEIQACLDGAVKDTGDFLWSQTGGVQWNENLESSLFQYLVGRHKWLTQASFRSLVSYGGWLCWHEGLDHSRPAAVVDKGAPRVNMFRHLVSSDDAVKAVFDHFRNIGIAGAVLAAGAWTLSHPASGLLRYMTWLSGGALCILGVFLFCVAERHGHRKFQEASVPWYWELAAVLVYAFATFALFTAAALRIELQ